MTASYLAAHLQQLLASDPHFREYWAGLDAAQQTRYHDYWTELDAFATRDEASLESEHSRAFDVTKRWFVRVQETELALFESRDDWWHVARDREAQKALFHRSAARIGEFIRFAAARRMPRWYGGIKPAESLDRKLLTAKTGDAVQQRLLDLWDLIRFRIVPDDLDDVLTTSIQFWEVFFDDVVRCRNYYYKPRITSTDDCYRAIHFELCDSEGNLTEVQVMTARRDAVSVLDHWHVFKRSGAFWDDGHRAWLLNMSRAANILDTRAFREDSEALHY